MSILATTKRNAQNRQLTTYELESVAELMDMSVPTKNASNYNRHIGETGVGYSWFDGSISSGSEALQKINDVDPMFFDLVKKKLVLITAPMNKKAVAREFKRKRKRIKADYGNALDIHEVRQGRLDRAWDSTKFIEREVHGSKIVHLLINTSMNAGVTSESAQWRAAAVIASHDALVKMGKSVSIGIARISQGCFSGRSSSEISMFYLPLKNAGTYMSHEHLCTYLSATFTRSVMMYKYSNSMEDRRPTSGYGFATDLLGLLPRPLESLKNAGQHVVKIGHCWTQGQAERMIENVVQSVSDPSLNRGVINA